MKHRVFAVCRFFCAIAAIACISTATWGVTPMSVELKKSRDFATVAFDPSKPSYLPFSFIYDNKASSQILSSWTIKSSVVKTEKDCIERVLTCTDPATGLEIRCDIKQYLDLPAIEWVLHLKNTGKSDTAIIEQIRPLDIQINGGDNFTIHHSLGDDNSAKSFAPVYDVLSADKPGPLVLAPKGGRSSDGNMPYFNIEWKNNGIAAAIGWSGEWESDFEVKKTGKLQFRAGQQLTHLKLHPSETIRTPRILFVFWNGDDQIKGNNLFRQVMIKHYMPRRDGKLVLAPICGSVNWAEPNGNYEKPHIKVMQPLADLGVEVFWSDMDPQQWYPKGFPEGTGTWEPDRSKYPNGLKPVGDTAKAAGLGYLLWFEPERVHPGSKIDIDHPAYVMKPKDEWSQLFRLHDEKARKWLTDYIDVQITDAGINWLRWDFNIEPLGFWRRNDEPDRQGITEIRHIEGLYAMWDELRARHPELVVDNCASGGRRIDIETCMRGLPLWHSDMQCFGPKPDADQLQNGGLNLWVPMHGCGSFELEPSYIFRSQMTAGNILLTLNSKKLIESDNAKIIDSAKKSVALYKKLRPYMVGDFYPLFVHSDSDAVWYGYQFDNPNIKAGYAMLFRREKNAESTKAIALRGIDPNATYEISYEDTTEKKTISGSELCNLTIDIPSAPGSAIVYYAQTK